MQYWRGCVVHHVAANSDAVYEIQVPLSGTSPNYGRKSFFRAYER
jgi:hypothetical protein